MTSQKACQSHDEGLLAARATLLDQLVHEQHGREEEEEVHPLPEAEQHAGKPDHERGDGGDPDHGIGSSRTTKARTASTTRSRIDATSTLAATTGGSSFTRRAPRGASRRARRASPGA